MAKSIQVRMKSSGAAALLNGPEMVADMDRRAKAVAAAAGVGYVGDGRAGRARAHGMARTDTGDSVYDNARRNTLLKSLGAGR